MGGGGGGKVQWMCSRFAPSIPGFDFSVFPRIFLLMLLRFIDCTAYCNIGQRLDNVDQTHLALVGGKLVLQKGVKFCRFSKRIVFFRGNGFLLMRLLDISDSQLMRNFLIFSCFDHLAPRHLDD